MKILWESDWQGARIEQVITHLSWIPQPDKPGHGLLGVGTNSGSVGVTITDFNPTPDDLARYNFNLRGHHNEIRMVTWNKAHTKLASCDDSGIIYVWVRNDDRWSVELVNDRGVKVTDLAWSPDGAHALICYHDNFVLIGSANGQRVWSNSFPQDNPVTCGAWAPDSKQLVLGFRSGTMQVLTVNGANITERSFTDEVLTQMTFSPVRGKDKEEEWTLAMLTSTNKVIMVNAYDQMESKVCRIHFHVFRMEWNPDGTILALINDNNELVMLNTDCEVVHKERLACDIKNKTIIPHITPLTKLSALTWAHDGKVIMVSAGGCLFVGKMIFGVPSLFEIVTYDLWKMMGKSAKRVDKLPIPTKEMNALRELDHHIIRCRIPRPQDLCSYVCSVVDARCYCTIRPLAKGRGGPNLYVLCFEHLGGLVPLLIGRQVNRFLPQFQIILYEEIEYKGIVFPPGHCAQVEDVNAIVSNSRGRGSLWRRSKRHIRGLLSKHVRKQHLETRLLTVSSNIWCTRFNIASIAPDLLPSFLGQVVYKTSVLHLQPRQMSIDLAVLMKNGKKIPTATVDDDDHLTSSKDGFTSEESQFFDKIRQECFSLKAAVDSSNFGAPPSTKSPLCQPSTSKDPETSTHTTPVSSSRNEHDVTSMTSSVSTWHEEIENLDYIDGEGTDERPLLVKPALKSGFTAMQIASNKKEAEIIRGHVNQLADLATKLIKDHGAFSQKQEKESINEMRSQMKELLRRVNAIEQQVAKGEKTEVRQLIKTLKEIKKTLGEGVPKNGRHPETGGKIETMSNKTPFWNEQNQVYQLDFGGRVTQESAKNFQIELATKQVLQFGRIEGGSYTLDFRYPFSACQAFAVALASITQRLK